MSRTKTGKQQEGGWVSFTVVFTLWLAGSTAMRAGVLEDVRTQFNKDKGSPRLVLLVSPT